MTPTVPCPFCGVPITLDPKTHGGHADGSCAKKRPSVPSSSSIPSETAALLEDLASEQDGRAKFYLNDEYTRNAATLRALAKQLAAQPLPSDLTPVAFRVLAKDGKTYSVFELEAHAETARRFANAPYAPPRTKQDQPFRLDPLYSSEQLTARPEARDRDTKRLDWLEAEARRLWEKNQLASAWMSAAPGVARARVAFNEIFLAGDLRKAIDARAALSQGDPPK